MEKIYFRSLVLLMCFFLSNSNVTAQEMDRARADAYAVNYLDGEGWSDYEETSVLITFDYEIDRITVYDNPRQIYDIIEDEGEEIDEDGDTWQNYRAIDKDGDECRFRILTRANGDPTQYYIEFDFVKWVYRIIELT